MMVVRWSWVGSMREGVVEEACLSSNVGILATFCVVKGYAVGCYVRKVTIQCIQLGSWMNAHRTSPRAKAVLVYKFKVS